MRVATRMLLPFSFVLLGLTPSMRCQTPAPAPATPGWLSSLSPDQRSLFDAANKNFNAEHFTAALPLFSQLHEAVPQSVPITKFTAETALDTGDYTLASSLLDPISALPRTTPRPSVSWLIFTDNSMTSLAAMPYWLIFNSYTTTTSPRPQSSLSNVQPCPTTLPSAFSITSSRSPGSTSC